MVGNMGIWQLVIIFVIVVLLFGTKKLRNIGGDLGSAVKGFKKAMTTEDSKVGDDSSNTEDKKLDVSDAAKTADGVKDIEKQKENG